MAKHDELGVILCLWRNKGALKLLSGSFGHSSLRLDGPPFQVGTQKSVYISWWPGKDRDGWTNVGILRTTDAKSARTFQQDKRSELGDNAETFLRMGIWKPRNGQYAEDEANPETSRWAKKPDIKIALPTLGASGVQYGLDAMRIYSWWKVFNAAPNGTWTTVRRNCSKIIAAALDAGGASEIVPMPRTALWRPNVLESWANRIVARCTHKNRGLDWIRAWGVKEHPELAADWDDVWDLPTWKERSDGGKGHRRSVAFRKIDGYLKKYDMMRPTFGGPRTVSHNPLPLLQLTLDAIHEDVLANPKFNIENRAALILGKQCMDAIERAGRRAIDLNLEVPLTPEELGQVEAPVVPDFDSYDEGAL
jgi:hypothetical protein